MTQTADLSPAQYAARKGIKTETVRQWIKTGELEAIDVSTNHGSGLPRWRIPLDAIARFERRRRAVVVPTKPSRVPKSGRRVTQYF